MSETKPEKLHGWEVDLTPRQLKAFRAELEASGQGPLRTEMERILEVGAKYEALARQQSSSRSDES